LKRLPLLLELNPNPEGKAMNTRHQFQLNGIIITNIKVRTFIIDGNPDQGELTACHENLDEFAIDDNKAFAGPALTPFISEVWDVTIPPIARQYLPNKGWKRMTTKECLDLLESAK
jgi:hypothetical protein